MKKFILVNSILIFLINFPLHFLYERCPNFLTSLFVPVNESIFEHLKMLFTAEVLFSIFTFSKKDYSFFLRMLLRGCLSVFILLILYLPIYYLLGEVMLVTFLILFITILLTEYILTFLPKKKHHCYWNVASVFLIIGIYILFTYFVYHPIFEKLFFDEENKKYGIDILDE